MIRRNVTLPELGLVAGTRMMLGAGIGLLVAGRLEPAQRRAAGWALLGVGVVTTFPLLAQIVLGDKPAPDRNHRDRNNRRQPAKSRVGASIRT